jgi:hypothetical protein
MALPFFDNFDGAATGTLLTAAYSALPSNASEPMYFKGGGSTAIVDGALSLEAARVTIGHKPPRNATTSGDTSANGDLDLSSEYIISFRVVSAPASGSGKFQITVDNNTTSNSNSMHGSSSRIFDEVASSLTEGQIYTVQSALGTANSFIMLRTEGGATVVIDDLEITYVD